MEMTTEEAIKSLLMSMASSIGHDNVELYKKLSEGVDFKAVTCPEEFRYAFLYPHERYIDGLINSQITNNHDAVFILEQSEFIERYFQNWIRKVEGAACCADKSRTIMRRLFNFYKEGIAIQFDYDAEYTFHLPKRIFRTHGEIVEFYETIRSLWYGNAEKYIANHILLMARHHNLGALPPTEETGGSDD